MAYRCKTNIVFIILLGILFCAFIGFWRTAGAWKLHAIVISKLDPESQQSKILSSQLELESAKVKYLVTIEAYVFAFHSLNAVHFDSTKLPQGWHRIPAQFACAVRSFNSTYCDTNFIVETNGALDDVEKYIEKRMKGLHLTYTDEHHRTVLRIPSRHMIHVQQGDTIEKDPVSDEGAE